MHADLLKLPIFTVSKFENKGEDLLIEGKFNYMTDFYIGVMDGASCLYLPPVHYDGNIIDFNKSTLYALFKTWIINEHRLDAGQEFVWLYGYYQPYYLNMFIDDINKWELKEYPDPVDHDHCLVCQAHICSKKDCTHRRSKYSYVYEENNWVCNDCFEKYLKINSLEFLIPNV